MSAVECREELDEDKAELLTRYVCFSWDDAFADWIRYRTGVEQALSRANFLRSLDLTVLQAFALYLVVVHPWLNQNRT